MKPKRVLVIGKTGQLARCIADELSRTHPLSVAFYGADEFDVTRCRSLPEIASGWEPDAIINTAAFHDPRACEADFDTAFRVNALGVANLLDAMPDGCHLYHLSTDYVFDGLRSPPDDPKSRYRVDDACHPRNEYGRTKRAGELIALASGCATVIRTSSLFSKYGSSGKGGSNFLLGMLRRGVEDEEHEVTGGGDAWKQYAKECIWVDSDVVMCPTYTPWLARAILHMVSEGLKPPIAHLVCEGPPVSWFDFAKAIFEVGGFTDALARLVPKHSDDWPPRPRFSALENSIPHIRMGTWQAALEEFFAEEWPKTKEVQT